MLAKFRERFIRWRLRSLRRRLKSRAERPPLWNSLERVKLLAQLATPLVVLFLGFGFQKEMKADEEARANREEEIRHEQLLYDRRREAIDRLSETATRKYFVAVDFGLNKADYRAVTLDYIYWVNAFDMAMMVFKVDAPKRIADDANLMMDNSDKLFRELNGCRENASDCRRPMLEIARDMSNCDHSIIEHLTTFTLQPTKVDRPEGCKPSASSQGSPPQ